MDLTYSEAYGQGCGKTFTGMSLLCVPCVPWHSGFFEDPKLKIGSVCANMGLFNSIGTHGLNFIKTSLCSNHTKRS